MGEVRKKGYIYIYIKKQLFELKMNEKINVKNHIK